MSKSQKLCLLLISVPLTLLVSSCISASNSAPVPIPESSGLASQSIKSDLREIIEVNFANDSNRILITGKVDAGPSLNSGAIEIWDTSDWQLVQTLTTDWYINRWASFTSPSGEEIVLLDEEGEISLWDVSSGEKTQILVNSEERDIFAAKLDYSSSQQVLAFGTPLGQLFWLDIRTGERIQLLSLEEDETFRLWSNVVFSADEKYFAAIAVRYAPETDERLGTITYIFDTETWEEIVSIPLNGENALDVAFLDDNRLLLAGNEGVLEVRDLQTGRLVQDFRGELYPLNMSIDPVPNSETFAISTVWTEGMYGILGTVSLWNSASGEVVCTTDVVTGTAGVNRDMDVSPDGKTLATTHGSELIIWDLEQCFGR